MGSSGIGLVTAVKNIVKMATPFGLIELRRRQIQWANPMQIAPQFFWEGVYDEFANVPVSGEGFSSKTWVERSERWTRAVIRAHQEKGPMPLEVMSEHKILVTLAWLLAREQKSLTILDFGGGMGMAYVYLIDSATSIPHLAYHVVELENLCRIGRALFENDSRIEFHSELPQVPTAVDIIYISTALQYASDYRGLLGSLIRYRPKYFLLTSLPSDVGIPTYASAQVNIEGSRIATWFFSLEEIVDLFTNGGYELVLDIKAEWGYDQSNFPESHRLRNGHTLLLTR